MWIHEQGKGYVTVCDKPMHPMMQTTIRWTGEKPTCPACRQKLYLPPLPVHPLARV